MSRDDVNPITEGVIWKQLLRYFAPLLAASFLQLLYNTADTIIVGRYVGKIALTAVGGSAGQIYAMVTEFLIGVSGGAGVILSQAYGAREKKLLDDGIDIISPACGLSTKTPVGNIAAMTEVVKDRSTTATHGVRSTGLVF